MTTHTTFICEVAARRKHGSPDRQKYRQQPTHRRQRCLVQTSEHRTNPSALHRRYAIDFNLGYPPQIIGPVRQHRMPNIWSCVRQRSGQQDHCHITLLVCQSF